MIFGSEKYICSSLRAGGLDLVCLITKATSLLLALLTLHKLSLQKQADICEKKGKIRGKDVRVLK